MAHSKRGRRSTSLEAEDGAEAIAVVHNAHSWGEQGFANPVHYIIPEQQPARGSAHDRRSPLYIPRHLRYNSSTMIIYPAIDLRGGRCVRLRQGRAEDETVYSDDPVADGAPLAEPGRSSGCTLLTWTRRWAGHRPTAHVVQAIAGSASGAGAIRRRPALDGSDRSGVCAGRAPRCDRLGGHRATRRWSSTLSRALAQPPSPWASTAATGKVAVHGWQETTASTRWRWPCR